MYTRVTFTATRQSVPPGLSPARPLHQPPSLAHLRVEKGLRFVRLPTSHVSSSFQIALSPESGSSPPTARRGGFQRESEERVAASRKAESRERTDSDRWLKSFGREKGCDQPKVSEELGHASLRILCLPILSPLGGWTVARNRRCQMVPANARARRLCLTPSRLQRISGGVGVIWAYYLKSSDLKKKEN
ncbi:hypothetical protein MC885_013077 [Smutsia gigantea]|nr:hypothetical protein MC885_013077 [Smutsia gigantea]